MYTYKFTYQKLLFAFTCIVFCMSVLPACEKYLEAKPDQSVSIPSTLGDMQALMDNASLLNTGFPSAAEMSSDNFYLADNAWMGLTDITAKNLYTWDAQTTNRGDWSSPYRVVSYANIVLDNMDKIALTTQNNAAYKRVLGTALFFRSFSFFQLAQYFAPVWDSSKAAVLLGIPLRLHAEITNVSQRASLQVSFRQIVHDMEEAVKYLPVNTEFKTQPTKAAGWAHIARVYLYMRYYEQAGRAADSSLALFNKLLDYNQADTIGSIPFKLMNDEVIFHARISGGSSLSNSATIVDSSLYASYETADLRKKLFFASRTGGGYSFKGSYLGELTPLAFIGFTAAEMLLVKAEVAARLGKTDDALKALNALLEKRYRKSQFVPVAIQDAELLLGRILAERRKELIFRGQRWADLKRLNLDPRFAMVLKRNIAGTLYQLQPNDLRYNFLIPDDVIKMTGMLQNPR
ncbi:MAG TPA: RagB/SusD family nutrient uptake outer membrane protein [Phnomibacter sp.]|nr:RagB/SusD family nutrient uptake outer membrane protein [Phnomibacter sp.]